MAKVNSGQVKYKRGAKLTPNPFWSPWSNGDEGKEKQKHPRSIQCRIVGKREMPSKLKAGVMQTVLDVETFDGEVFCIGGGGALLGIVAAVKLGQAYEFEFLGKKRIEGKPEPMNDVACYPLSMEETE